MLGARIERFATVVIFILQHTPFTKDVDGTTKVRVPRLTVNLTRLWLGWKQVVECFEKDRESEWGPSIETGSPRERFWREQVVNLNVGYVVARENYCHVARNGFCAT